MKIELETISNGVHQVITFKAYGQSITEQDNTFLNDVIKLCEKYNDEAVKKA